MREPIANKTHYANGETLLDKQITELFEHEKGPGALPATKLDSQTDKPLKGIIVPHAPYKLAGPCMAWAYGALAEEAREDPIYIIIAQAQQTTQDGATMETYAMPYGEVRVDQTFLRALIEKGNIQLNDKLHATENVVEIQLPMLQFARKPNTEKIKIVPLIVGPTTKLNELSIDIKETLLEQNKEAICIFVSNLTAYGRDFKYVPFTEHIPEEIAKVDKQFIQAIKTHDKEAFKTAVKETLAPLSGYHALLLYFYLLNPENTEIEQYYLSGDMNKNYNASVSYASFLIR